MTSSLVGSEMCIRDSRTPSCPPLSNCVGCLPFRTPSSTQPNRPLYLVSLWKLMSSTKAPIGSGSTVFVAAVLP
eukprot:5626800-Prorocentrum_lima.AAC.1